MSNFERTQQLSSREPLEEVKTAAQPKIETQNTNLLSKFLSDESADKDLEVLIKENQGLHEQIDELRAQLKDAVPLSKHQEAEATLQSKDEALKRLMVENKELVKMFELLTKERNQVKADLTKSKAEKIAADGDLAGAKKDMQTAKLEFDQKEALFEQSIKAIKQSLDQVQEEKIVAQKEAKEKEKHARDLEQEN